MRIAIGGIATESCTFSPLPTTLDDFKVVRGDALLARYPFLADHPGVSPLPLLVARALPGGSVTPDAYNTLKTELLEGLRAALPVDGVYLDLHGAMHVAGADDAEGDLITAIRAVIGDTPIFGASFDLHANISDRIVTTLDLLTTFRTAPHVDVEATRQRAFRLIVRAITTGERPYITRQSVPVMLPGEKTSTEWSPGDQLYAMLDHSDKLPDIWEAAIFVGYCWADEPRAGTSICVTSTDDRAPFAETRRLAAAYWQMRDHFRFGAPAMDVPSAIVEAEAFPGAPVVISDSGDNPTAGGAGDVPILLAALIAHKASSALIAGIASATAAAACHAAGEDAVLSLTVGGVLDPLHGAPCTFDARVVSLHPDGAAVVQSGGVTVIVTPKRQPFHHESDFLRYGVEPRAFQIVVVKMGYLVPEIKALAAHNILALTPGAVDQAITRLTYRRIQRPMFPFDSEMDMTLR